jgi:hypothetical protein
MELKGVAVTKVFLRPQCLAALARSTRATNPPQRRLHGMDFMDFVVLMDLCQQSRRTRLAIDFSTGCACVSHASGMLGVCVMITLPLLRIEAEC